MSGFEKNKVVVAVENKAVVLDPRLTTNGVELKISMLLFPGLMTFDDRLNLVPLIAESVVTTDAKTYEITLKKGIRFHDNTELTTEDVAYTYESLASSELVSPHAEMYRKITSITIHDPYHMTVILDAPFSAFPFRAFTMGIVPKHLAVKKDAFLKNPIGSGAFKFAKLSSDGTIYLQVFNDYFGAKAKIDNLIFKTIPDNTVRMLELIKGDVHLLFANDILSSEQLEILKKEPHLDVQYSKGTSCSYILFNNENAYLKNKLVRQAIYYAINRDNFIKYKFNQHAAKAKNFLPPTSAAFENNVRTYDYNPEKAKQLLDQAGFKLKKGSPFRFKLTFKTSTNKDSIDRIKIIAQDLEKVGIAIDIRSFEWGVFFEDIKKGSFDLYSMTQPTVADPDMYYYFFSKESFPPNGANRGKFTNDKIEALLGASRLEIDPLKRKALFSDVQKILSEEVPMLPLWHEDDVIVINKNLKEFVAFPTRSYQNMVNMFWQK